MPAASPKPRSTAVSRARSSGLESTASGCEAVGAKVLAQRARLFVPCRRERAQLVRIARRGFGVANEHEPHTGAVGYLCGSRSATSLPTSSPTRALTGNQLAVFTDGREVDDETMQKLAKEMNSPRPSSCCRVGGRARTHPHLHAGDRAAVRRPSGARIGVRARQRRCSSARSGSRPAPASFR